jgi:diphthamide biosynthesis protein 4
MSSTPTHYEVLDLPEGIRKTAVIPKQTLRTAYRRALLRSHPDKSSTTLPTENQARVYSIDQISQAFTVLQDSKSRARYDGELRLQGRINDIGVAENQPKFHTGIDTIDLDDLETEEGQGIWYRSCRCGERRGFLIVQRELEEAAEDGEIDVGCRGCSLWLKVLFAVIDIGDRDSDDEDPKFESPRPTSS